MLYFVKKIKKGDISNLNVFYSVSSVTESFFFTLLCIWKVKHSFVYHKYCVLCNKVIEWSFEHKNVIIDSPCMNALQ